MQTTEHPHHNLARALQKARKALGVTQEDFVEISSRTYVSAVERGLKVPTLSKIDEFAKVMEIHPLTLLTLAYSPYSKLRERESLLERVSQELKKFAPSDAKT